MKKKNNQMRIVGMLVMMSLLLAGCGGSGKAMETASQDAAPAEEGISYDSAAYGAGNYAVMEEAVEAEAPAAEAGSGNESVDMAQTQRKLIRNVELNVETENFDALMQTVSEKTKELEGYVESSYIYNGSQYYENNRDASLTLRIPAEKLDTFLSVMAESSNVTRQNENVEDVTLQYVDLESRKEALTTEQERLIELLERAETVEDIITIEGRLSEVRYQIESMESQLRTLSNQVSYSTVYLYITEVKRYTPVKEQTVWEEIATGFVNSLYDVGEGIQDFFIGLIINIPYLVIWAAVITVIVLIVKVIRKMIKNKKRKKEEMKEDKKEDRKEEEK